MSHLLSPYCNCPTLQEELDLHFTQCHPTKMRHAQESSVVQFLRSATNTNNLIQQRVAPGRGKLRTLELTYTPRVRLSEIGNNGTGVNCTNTNKSGCVTHTCEIDVDNNVYVEETFDPRDLATICKDNELHVAERIQAMMDGAIRRLDQRVVSDMAACVGNFAEGESDVNASDEKTVETKKSNGDPDTNAIEEIGFATMNAGYCSAPYLFGYNEIYKYLKYRIPAGCCADSGLDIARMLQQNQMLFMPNVNIETTFGTDHFISLAAGAVQLLTYNEFEGREGLNQITTGGDHQRFVLRDPLTNIPFDVLINRPCDGNYNVWMRIIYEVCCMPNDLFSTGDRLAGVTQVNEWRIVNP